MRLRSIRKILLRGLVLDSKVVMLCLMCTMTAKKCFMTALSIDPTNLGAKNALEGLGGVSTITPTINNTARVTQQKQQQDLSQAQIDRMDFGEAFAYYRTKFGSTGNFKWQGKVFSTKYKEEVRYYPTKGGLKNVPPWQNI
eukprot:PhF_6_TR42682/c1_g2_i16/m.64374